MARCAGDGSCMFNVLYPATRQEVPYAMRILFDAYWWVEGPNSNRSVERQFITTWVMDYPDDEVVLVVPRSQLEAARADAPSRVRIFGTRVAPQGIAAALAMPLIARKVKADVILSHNFAPLWGKSATFVHDMLWQINPGWFTIRERAYFWLIPRLAHRADVLMTSSQDQADSINRKNKRLQPVVAVGLAVSLGLRDAHPLRPAAMIDIDEFVLTVGRLNIRKNLAATLDAAILSGTISAARPFVVVGEPDGPRAPLPATVTGAIDDGRIIMVPHVSDAELSWLYRNARLFVFMSLNEGYGLPPVEAQLFGCPVLVSDISVFRETMGSTANFAPPSDIGAIAREMARLVDTAGRLPAKTSTDDSIPSWSECTRRLRQAVLAALGDRELPASPRADQSNEGE